MWPNCQETEIYTICCPNKQVTSLKFRQRWSAKHQLSTATQHQYVFSASFKLYGTSLFNQCFVQKWNTRDQSKNFQLCLLKHPNAFYIDFEKWVFGVMIRLEVTIHCQMPFRNYFLFGLWQYKHHAHWATGFTEERVWWCWWWLQTCRELCIHVQVKLIAQ